VVDTVLPKIQKEKAKEGKCFLAAMREGYRSSLVLDSGHNHCTALRQNPTAN